MNVNCHIHIGEPILSRSYMLPSIYNINIFLSLVSIFVAMQEFSRFACRHTDLLLFQCVVVKNNAQNFYFFRLLFISLSSHRKCEACERPLKLKYSIGSCSIQLVYNTLVYTL